MAITLFWSPRTRASRAVWLLEEVGVPYERVTLDLSDPDSRKNPGFCRASPMNKVPAMIDGPVAMADSSAMALYLADRYASGRLSPAIDAPDRGRFLFWAFLVLTDLVVGPVALAARTARSVRRTAVHPATRSVMSRAGPRYGPESAPRSFQACLVTG